MIFVFSSFFVVLKILDFLLNDGITIDKARLM